ncbi:MAG: arginase family protein, partial [Arachnia sp.]
MKCGVVVCQGRVADRTTGARAGARLTGAALGEYLQVPPLVVGTPSPPEHDDWSHSLPAAEPTLTALREALVQTLDSGLVPVVATNTCAASLATLPEVARRFPEAVVLWIDAHGDFNTPATTASGYLGGMVLAAACGLWDSGHGAGLNPRQVALVGVRDIDPAEQELLDQAGVRSFTPKRSTARHIADFVADRPVWIHVDWDVLEPGYVPAAYKVPGGLLPRHIAELFAGLPSGQVLGIELAEFEVGEPGVPEALSLELIVETFQH